MFTCKMQLFACDLQRFAPCMTKQAIYTWKRVLKGKEIHRNEVVTITSLTYYSG